MKKVITLLFILLFGLSAIYSQAIVGGSGTCITNGNPNTVASLYVIDSKSSCTLVKDTVSGKLYSYVSSNPNGYKWVLIPTITQDSTSNWLVGGNQVNTHQTIVTLSNYDFIFKVNNIERMRILANGNVGIETTTPTQKLDVNGNARIRTLASGASTDSVVTVDATGVLNRQTVANVTGWVQSGSNMYSAKMGNIGIGTSTSLSSKFTLDNQSTEMNQFYNESLPLDLRNSSATNNTWSGLIFTVAGGLGAATIQSKYTDKVNGYAELHFATRASDGFNTRLYISESGKVGIGTTTPSQKLDIVGMTKTTNLQVTSGAANGYVATTDGSGNLSWVNPTSITTATPLLSTLVSANASTGGTLNVPYGSGVGAGIVTETYSRWGQTRLRFGLNLGSGADQYSGGNATSTLSGYGGVNLVTGDSTRLRVGDGGNVGINTINPVERLHVIGRIRSNDVMASSANSIATEGAYLQWDASAGDGETRLVNQKGGGVGGIRFGSSTTSNTFTEWMRLDAVGNLGIGTTTASEKLTVNGNGTFTGTVLGANATADEHLMNRITSDNRYWQKGGQAGTLVGGSTNNSDVSLIRNNVTRLLVSSIATTITNTGTTLVKSTTGTTPPLTLENGNGTNSAILISEDLSDDIGGTTSNGDLLLNPNTGNIVMKVADKRKDIAFGVNHKQLFNTSFTDGADSSFVNLSDTTSMLRITNSGVTSYARINMPQNPQTNVKMTVLIQNAPTTLNFRIVSGVSGQSFIGTTTFTPAVGDVYQIWFDSDNEQSVGGKWYVKKL